jgi:hypothetical protein
MNLERATKDRFCSPRYLDFIRGHRCCVCQKLRLIQQGGTTASHMISTKWLAGSDALAVPACLTHHPQSTRAARRLIEIHTKIDLDALYDSLWREFLKQEGLIAPPILTQAAFEKLLIEAGLTEDAFTLRKNHGTDALTKTCNNWRAACLI